MMKGIIGMKRKTLISIWFPFLLALSIDMTSRSTLWLSNVAMVFIVDLISPYNLHAQDAVSNAHEIISNLSGTALAVAVMMYMIHYFMKREEKRENFISTVIEKNTDATKENTLLMKDIREVLKEKSS